MKFSLSLCEANHFNISGKYSNIDNKSNTDTAGVIHSFKLLISIPKTIVFEIETNSVHIYCISICTLVVCG